MLCDKYYITCEKRSEKLLPFSLAFTFRTSGSKKLWTNSDTISSDCRSVRLNEKESNVSDRYLFKSEIDILVFYFISDVVDLLGVLLNFMPSLLICRFIDCAQYDILQIAINSRLVYFENLKIHVNSCIYDINTYNFHNIHMRQRT